MTQRSSGAIVLGLGLVLAVAGAVLRQRKPDRVETNEWDWSIASI